MAKRLEQHPFMKYVQKMWKNKDHDYVISYLKASTKIGTQDMIYDDIMFLIQLKQTIKELS